MMHRTNEEPKMTQLDGLRALAVMAVVLGHALPEDSFANRLGAGFLGVRLFFVISGFLITGILLRARLGAEAEGAAKGGVLARFYARRFLRIFPAYYALLAILLAAGLAPLAESWAWHASYLSNYYFALKGAWVEPISHFWSLGVEEQFYLFWPALVLFVPRRYLAPAIVATILSGPVSRAILGAMTGNGITAKSVTFSCMDMLGLGAMLAYVGAVAPARARLFGRAALAAGIAVGAATVALKWLDVGWAVRAAALDLSSALGFTWLVGAAAARIPGLAGRALELAPVQYVGRISYGIYLVHNLVPWAWERTTAALGAELAFPGHGPARVAVMTALSIAVASVSWRFFEEPINRLKRHFPYLPQGNASRRTADRIPSTQAGEILSAAPSASCGRDPGAPIA